MVFARYAHIVFRCRNALDQHVPLTIQISTSLTPVQLLGFLKSIEKHIGRRKTIEKGPREIDLDLLLYDDIVMRDEEVDLTVPHPLIAEREFVLRPLNE